jgi:hypothetical protein
MITCYLITNSFGKLRGIKSAGVSSGVSRGSWQ